MAIETMISMCELPSVAVASHIARLRRATARDRLLRRILGGIAVIEIVTVFTLAWIGTP